MSNPYEAPGCPETNAPYERIVAVFSAFFPGKASVRARGRTCFPSPGAEAVCGPTHGLRFSRHGAGACRETWSRLLPPRNLSVPSSRPPPQGGGTVAVRQCAAGAGEGQHPAPLATIAPGRGAGAGVHATAEGSGMLAAGLLGVHGHDRPIGRVSDVLFTPLQAMLRSPAERE